MSNRLPPMQVPACLTGECASLRDLFAGWAMAAMLRNVTVDDGFTSQAVKEERARRAYEEADAMLAARGNKPATTSVNADAIKALKGLRDVIHDCVTHKEQEAYAEYIEAADKAIEAAGGAA